MTTTNSKQGSTARRIATPKASNSPSRSSAWQEVGNMDAALSKAVGGRIRVTTAAPTSTTYEGTVFAACPVTNAIAINTASGHSAGDFRIVPTSQISSFQIISAGSKDGAAASPSSSFTSFTDSSLAIGEVDISALRAREADAIAKLREHDATRGRGVTKEAQEIFNWFRRTLPTRWNDQQIIVSDAVVVSPPYAVENCRAPKNRKPAEEQIKRVLEGYYQKRKGGNSSTTTAVNSGANTPAGGPRTVVPALPRKGG